MKQLLIIIALLTLSSCKESDNAGLLQVASGVSYLGLSKDERLALYKFEYEFDDNNICYIVRDTHRAATSISCVPKSQSQTK